MPYIAIYIFQKCLQVIDGGLGHRIMRMQRIQLFHAQQWCKQQPTNQFANDYNFLGYYIELYHKGSKVESVKHGGGSTTSKLLCNEL